MQDDPIALQHEKLTPQDHAKALTTDEVAELQRHIFGWSVESHDTPRLMRTFKFENFADALAFVNKVGEIAENAGHHPRISFTWGSATVYWWSHELGGLHKNDFILAAKTNDIYVHWAEIMGEKDPVDEALEETFPASDPPAVGGIIE